LVPLSLTLVSAWLPRSGRALVPLGDRAPCPAV